MSELATYWDEFHRAGKMDKYRDAPSDFALATARKLKVGKRLLELGCGTGGDAQYFARLGQEVTATDVSPTVIVANRDALPDVTFQVVDMAEPFPFIDEAFDDVYANLSLHYFDDEITQQVVFEIHRVLRPKGTLFFRCKSIYSVGEKENAEEVAPDIYVKNGHIRHLFSTAYTAGLLEGKFAIRRCEYTTGDAYGYESYFVECEAAKV